MVLAHSIIFKKSCIHGGYEFDPRIEATLLSGVFSPVISAEAHEESSRWLWK